MKPKTKTQLWTIEVVDMLGKIKPAKYKHLNRYQVYKMLNDKIDMDMDDFYYRASWSRYEYHIYREELK